MDELEQFKKRLAREEGIRYELIFGLGVGH